MKSFALFTLALFAIFSLNAQDEKKSEIRVTIEKDGKVVKDTVYMVEEGRSIKHASKILDMTFGEHKSGEHHKMMTFHSKDGGLHEMHSEVGEMGEEHEMMMKMIHEGDMGEEHEMMMKMIHDGDMGEEHEMMMKMIHDGDMQVFVTTEEGENGETKVIVKKIKIDKDGDHSFTNKDENVFIMKGGEDGEFKHIHHHGEKPIWIEEDGVKILIIDSEDGTKKTIKIITDSESDHEFITKDGNTIIIYTSEDCENKKEVKVEVIVVDEKSMDKSKKKKVKKTRNK